MGVAGEVYMGVAGAWGGVDGCGMGRCRWVWQGSVAGELSKTESELIGADTL